MKILISETTCVEREQIVNESIGNISGACDGCSAGIIEMYQPYIDGEMELKECNASFRSSYVSGMEQAPKGDCGYKIF